MPLRLLKRTSKQYNVVSKSMFVISVELLDSVVMECTLDADSTGKDCLQNISQRLGLHQPDFFGLRYISRGVPPRVRWVELERPLKKQLDKYAQDTHLSLGVMFYVSDVNLLKDEMARYHYFLQLKSDVIDGKLNCSVDQAISLAAYSLQAEFGDYDPERHTIEYLREFAILPKELTTEEKYVEINIDALYEAVAHQYGSLIGFPPPLSEIYYVMVAQQLDGYGQEAYPAKDDSGNEILICVSVNGLVIRRRDWTHISAFRWSDIKSLMGHKRLFVVESAQSQRTMQFHFTDPEVAKYVRKMCLLQSTFCKSNLKPESTYETRTNANSTSAQNNNDRQEGASSYSALNLRSTPELISGSGTRNGSEYSLNNNTFPHGSASGFPVHFLQSSSSSGLQRQIMEHKQALNSGYHPSSLVEISKSTLNPSDLPSLNLNVTAAKGKGDAEVHSLLPAYRSAPDYDTAVQMKYGQGSSIYYENQIHEDEPIYQNEIVSQIHSIELRDSLSKVQSPGPEAPIEVPTLLEDAQKLFMYKPPPPYPGHSKKVEASGTSKGRTSLINITPESKSEKDEPTPSTSSAMKNEMSSVTTAVPGTTAHHKKVHGRNSHGHQTPSNLSSTSLSSLNSQKRIVGSLPELKKNRIYEQSIPLNTIMSFDTTDNKAKTEQLYGKAIDENILTEFRLIMQSKPDQVFSNALKRENTKRNRCPDVLPYEDNAIVLSPSRFNATGYINASPVLAHISGRDWRYIIGQIPLAGNAPLVWQMIYETEAQIVAVLEKDPTAPFYPTESATLTFNDFQIESKSERSNSASIAREFNLHYLPKKKHRKVWVLPYEEEWKDDVPIHDEHFLCYLEEVNSIQRKVSEPTLPLVVLCGNGAGRSGVLVLSDLLLHAADSGHKLRCDNLLKDLRTQRMKLVSSASQYAFVLHTLAKYLAQSRLI